MKKHTAGFYNRSMLSNRIRSFLHHPGAKLLLLFGLEGVLFQFVNSVNVFGNSLYATNLGATDTQIGLIQTIPNLIAIALLLPAGILADRARSTKTIPVILLVIAGFSYLFLGTVPVFSENRMFYFFLSLGLSIGVLANYNASWQIFFGSVTDTESRNDVYTTRNRFMFFIGTLTPLLCGAAMASMAGSENSVTGKLNALRIFYYLSGLFLFLQAFIIWKIPGGTKSDEEMEQTPAFHLGSLRDAICFMVRDRSFRSFFLSIMIFYITWQIDWSTWYLAQIQYVGMTEMHFGYFNALICVVQLMTIGFFSRMNRKRSVHFTFLYAIMGLAFCPLVVIITASLARHGVSSDIVPWVFIVLGLIGNVPQCCIGLCTVQMLLDVLPEKNRSLITSLYTICVTLSNSLMPLFGVKLYTWMGADYRALVSLYLLVFFARVLVYFLFLRRSRRLV